MKSHLFYTNMLTKLALIVWISASSLVVSAQLAAPNNLRVDRGDFDDRRVYLKWQFSLVSTPGLRINGFDVERSMEGSSHFTLIGSPPYIDRYVHTYENELRDPGDFYCYRVRARYWDEAARVTHYSDYSNVICVDTRLAIPHSLRISAYNFATSSVKLEWEAAYLNRSYVLERSEGDTTNFRPITPINYESTEFEDRGGVIRGRRYYYRVKAKGFHHYSGYSNIVEFYERPFPIPMKIFIQEVVRLGRPLIRIDWKIDLEKQTHFIIERSDIVKDQFYEIGKVSGDLREFLDEKPLEKDISYYRVKVMAGSEVLTTSEVIDITVSQEGEEIIAYPNPFKDHFTIKLPQGVKLGKVQMIAETIGKEVEFDLKLENDLAHIYPHSSLKEGYYIVYAYSEKGEELGKFRMLKVDK